MMFSKSMLLNQQSKRKEVMAARLMFARQLMVRYGVPYNCVLLKQKAAPVGSDAALFLMAGSASNQFGC